MKHFLAAMAAISSVATAWAQAQTDQTQQAYEALAKGTVWVHPSAAKMVDIPAIEAVAKEIEPMKLKVLVVPTLGQKWVKNGKEMRGSYAKWLLEDRLTLKDGLVIIYTKKGIGSYSDRIADSKLANLNNEATKYAQQRNFTPAITWLAKEGAKNARTASNTKTGATAALILIPIGVGAAIWGVTVGRKKLAMSQARGRVEGLRVKALEGIGYLDNYADLLPAGEDADRVRSYRERAFGLYEQAGETAKAAQKPEDLHPVGQMYQDALHDIDLGKQHILAATGGSKVAYAVPPIAPQQDYAEDRSIYQPVANVCFFCSRPGHGDLTPVTMVIDGQKKTVLVCPDDMAELRAGREPNLRGMNQGGRFVPWYGVQGYNPNVHYGTGSFLFDMMAISAISNMFNPFGWGLGYGFGGGIHHHYHDSGGSFGGHSDSGGGFSEIDTSGDFGGGDFGGSWGDSGGGDFGGGDFGGGDFGGGDF